MQECELELYDVWKEVWEIRIPFHYSRLQKSCNKQAEQWKTTIGLNREVGLAEAGKIIRFIVVNQLWFSTVQLALLQDFCNLLYNLTSQKRCLSG